MRPLLVKAITASSLYVLILLLIGYSYIPQGEIPDFGISFPYQIKLGGTSWEEINGVYYSECSKRTYLVLPRVDCEGLEVIVNGDTRFMLGGDGVNSKIWMASFAVPIELRKGKNSIVIRMWASNYLTVNVPPFITDHPWLYVYLSNALFTWLPGFLSPMLMALGIFYIYSAMALIKRRTFVCIGISSILAGIYLVFYTTIPQLATTEVYYSFFNKISLVSILPMMGTYLGAVENFTGKERVYKIVSPVLLATAVFLAIFEEYGFVNEFVKYFAPPLIVVVMSYAIYRFVMEGYYEYTVAASVLMVATVQHSIDLSVGRPDHPVLMVAIAYNFVDFLRYLAESYRKINVLELKAMTDPLTGLYNRSYLSKLKTSEKDAVIFIDIDGFKEINDTKGHAYGDWVLKTLARVIRENVKGKDVAMRYGGDEFVIVLRDCVDCWFEIVEGIRREFMKITGCDISYGYHPGGDDVIKSLRMADEKMYRMKFSKKAKQRT